MRAISTTFILLATLWGAANSYAENYTMEGLPLPATQNPPIRAISHIDYLSNSFLSVAGKLQAREPPSVDTMKAGITKSIAPNEDSPVGLHWLTDTHHPILELRFSDQSAIRFHPTRHGSSIAIGWKF